MYKKVTTTDDDGVILKERTFKYTLFSPEKGYLFKPRANSIKSYTNIKLSDILKSKAEIGNLYTLAENMYQNTNLICYKKNKKYYAADIAEMAEILVMHPKRTKEFVYKMINLGLIAKAIINTEERITIHYYINPLYFNTNKYISPTLYMMFRECLDQHLPQWVINQYNECLK